MGIFKDFATSSLGDLTIGAFQGIEDAAERDGVLNATASSALDPVSLKSDHF